MRRSAGAMTTASSPPSPSSTCWTGTRESRWLIFIASCPRPGARRPCRPVAPTRSNTRSPTASLRGSRPCRRGPSRSPASASATLSPSTASESRSKTGHGGWSAPRRTSRNWWSWSRARRRKRACPRCSRLSTGSCARTPKSAPTTKRSEMAGFEIEKIAPITPSVADSVAALVGQLSSSAKAPSREELEAIVKAAGTVVLAVRQSGNLVGMLTLVTFAIPTGIRAIIEDVVVDERYRGQGVAQALTREALVQADAAGARTVDLTSRPSREAANRLYQKLGFQKRDSNVYRYTLR